MLADSAALVLGLAFVWNRWQSRTADRNANAAAAKETEAIRSERDELSRLVATLKEEVARLQPKANPVLDGMQAQSVLLEKLSADLLSYYALQSTALDDEDYRKGCVPGFRARFDQRLRKLQTELHLYQYVGDATTTSLMRLLHKMIADDAYVTGANIRQLANYTATQAQNVTLHRAHTQRPPRK
jgi:hypothetical protein